jgi:hypothetical protein
MLSKTEILQALIDAAATERYIDWVAFSRKHQK